MTELTLFDGHVHVHKKTDAAAMLTAAAQNFSSAAAALTREAWHGALLLTEMAHRQWFEEMAACVGVGAELGPWRLTPSLQNGLVLWATHRDGTKLAVVAGRQVITSERIEVLALATRSRIADGAPLEKTISMVQDAGAVAVLPWGAGKWLGIRGRLVKQALSLKRARPVFAGDNGGRLQWLRRPAAFAISQEQNLPVLPGTDPLALPGEELHVGSCGFAISDLPPQTITGEALQLALSRGAAQVHSFARHVGPLRFIRNQMALRIRGERYP